MIVGYIYKTTNNINGKFYIGKRYGNFDIRYFGSGLILQVALKKYGKEHFSIKIIEECDNEFDLNQKEKEYIKNLKPHYNIAEGGTGGNTLKYSTEEFKKDVIIRRAKSLSKRHNSLTKEERNAWNSSISLSKKGKSRLPRTTPFTDDERKRRSESNKYFEGRKKPIKICDSIYKSRIDAARQLNVSYETIRIWLHTGKAVSLC